MKRHVKTAFVVMVLLVIAGLCLTPSKSLAADSNSLPGKLEGTGTHFELIDSNYKNVILDSTETVHVVLESVPETVSLHIEPASDATLTQLTLGGLNPLTTYYKYEDDYRNVLAFTTDQQGKFSFDQDISVDHLIFIQPRPSTIHLSNSGWDNNHLSIGTWDPNTKTATLTKDITETIQIEDSGITIDGGGHSMTGSLSGNGIYLNNVSNITVKNITIKNFSVGICFNKGDGNTVIDTNLENNIYGINLRGSSTNGSNLNRIYNNNFKSNSCQAYVDSKSNDNIFSLSLPTGGNYWSNYTSSDLNNDAIVDAPYNYFGVLDNLPWVRENVWLDTLPPATAITLSGTAGSSDWYRSDVVVTLNAEDNGTAGLAKTRYSLDGVNWHEYTAPFTVTNEGTTQIKFYSTDNRENSEAIQTKSLNIDKTAPVINGNLTTTYTPGESGGSISLAWTAATDNVAITGYRIERSPDGSTGWTQIATSTETNYADTTVLQNATYYYRIIAVDAANNPSDPSASVSVTTSGAPDTQAPSVPTGLTAIAISENKINLSWTASTDNIGVTGYRIERSLNGTSGWTQVGTSTATSCGDTTVSQNTTYYYRIIAVDGANNSSDPSASVSVTTSASSDTQAPSAPTGLTATAISESKIDLSWTASTDNVGVTGYRIERSLNGTSGWLQIGISDITSYLDTTVSESVKYYYRVIAVDGANNASSPSDTVSVTTPKLTVQIIEETSPSTEYTGSGWATVTSTNFSGSSTIYATKAGNAVTFSFKGIGVRWYGAKYINRGIAKVYIDGVLQGAYDQYQANVLYKQVIYEKKGLTSGNHTIRVEVTGTKNDNAINTITCIDYFEVITEPDTQPPLAPTVLTALPVSATMINLSWSGATDNVGITGYRIERSADGSTGWTQVGTSATTGYSDKGLTINTKYYYRVIAVDSANNASSPSTTTSATTPILVIIKIDEASPSTVYTGTGWASSNSSNFSGNSAKYATRAGNAVTFSFSGNGVRWYGAKYINRGIANVYIDGMLQDTCDQYGMEALYQQMIYEKTGLNNGSHTIMIEATGTRNENASNTVTCIDYFEVITEPDTQLPSAPTGLMASAVSLTGLKLSWAGSIDNVGLTGYRIERSADGTTGWTQIGASTTNSYSDTGLIENTTYYYRVIAVDAANNPSSPSNTASATTLKLKKSEESSSSTVYTGTGWASVASSNFSGNSTIYAFTAGNEVTFSFTGNGVRWYGAKYINRGIAKVYIDGVQQGTYDQYGANILYQQIIYEKTGLTNGSHTLRIQVTGTKNVNANNTITCIDYFEVITEPDDTQPPSVPIGLTALAVSRSRIDLNWTASNDNVGVTEYRIERSADGIAGWHQIGTSSTTNYSDTGLIVDTKYYYRVIAVDAANNSSSLSSTASATTPYITLTKIEETSPAAVYTGSGWVSVSSSKFSGDSTIYATKVGNDVTFTFRGIGIRWYGVKYINRGMANVYIDGVLQGTYDQYGTNALYKQIIYQKTGLASGSHTIRVEATGTKNNSANNTITCVDYFEVITEPDSTQPPSVPTGLTATAVSGSRIDLNWTASNDNVGVAEYRIERSADGIAGWSQIGAASTNSYSDTGLMVDTTYYYRVIAVDADNNSSSPSNNAGATTSNVTKIEENFPAAVYTGSGWASVTSSNFSGNSTRYATTAGNEVTFSFTGNGVRWYGAKYINRGIAKVYIDGVLQGNYDQYGTNVAYQQLIYEKTGLTNGSHTIKIVATGTKNANANNTITCVDYFEVITN